MSKYIQDYPSTLMRFDEPFAYVTFTNFDPGQGLMQIHSDWGTYSCFWGAMGKDRTIEQFVADCGADYIHGNLMMCVTYQSMKRDAKSRLDRFMIKCWPAIHEKLKEMRK
jgi:hypothetical protein